MNKDEKIKTNIMSWKTTAEFCLNPHHRRVVELAEKLHRENIELKREARMSEKQAEFFNSKINDDLIKLMIERQDSLSWSDEKTKAKNEELNFLQGLKEKLKQ